MEVWKDIQEYENKYQVSNLGRVRSLINCRGNVLKEPKILKDFKNNRDYHSVALCKDGIRTNFLVHRLVGVAFIENPENKPTIDHKDKNKSNNQVSNLRWATNDEQLENKEYPKIINSVIGASGEKYIHYMPKLNKFRVYNKRHNQILEYFETKEEAIKFRNDYLNNIYNDDTS